MPVPSGEPQRVDRRSDHGLPSGVAGLDSRDGPQQRENQWMQHYRGGWLNEPSEDLIPSSGRNSLPCSGT